MLKCSLLAFNQLSRFNKYSHLVMSYLLLYDLCVTKHDGSGSYFTIAVRTRWNSIAQVDQYVAS